MSLDDQIEYYCLTSTECLYPGFDFQLANFEAAAFQSYDVPPNHDDRVRVLQSRLKPITTTALRIAIQSSVTTAYSYQTNQFYNPYTYR